MGLLKVENHCNARPNQFLTAAFVIDGKMHNLMTLKSIVGIDGPYRGKFYVCNLPDFGRPN